MKQLREHTWNPLLWMPGEALYLLLSRDTAAGARTGFRPRSAAGCGPCPEPLAVARDRLANMPRVHVETALTQISGLFTMLREEIPPLARTAPRTFLSVEPMRTAAEDALVESTGTAAGAPRARPRRRPLRTRGVAAELRLALDA